MRHREIARQATEWCVNNAKGAPTAWEWEDKFAELLIQECIMIAYDMRHELQVLSEKTDDPVSSGVMQGGVTTANSIASLIRSRFGLDRNLQLDNQKET